VVRVQSSELSRLVDNVGRRLGRSVAIDDPKINLLAYNSHRDEVDAARTSSIHRRAVDREVVDFVYSRGVADANDPVEVPFECCTGHDISQLVMTIGIHGVLLGFVWLLLSEGPVDDVQAEVLRHTAASVAAFLHREHLMGELTRNRERELARDLLADDPTLPSTRRKHCLTRIFSFPVLCGGGRDRSSTD
jgi:hypothetical protein